MKKISHIILILQLVISLFAIQSTAITYTDDINDSNGPDYTDIESVTVQYVEPNIIFEVDVNAEIPESTSFLYEKYNYTIFIETEPGGTTGYEILGIYADYKLEFYIDNTGRNGVNLYIYFVLGTEGNWMQVAGTTSYEIVNGDETNDVLVMTIDRGSIGNPEEIEIATVIYDESGNELDFIVSDTPAPVPEPVIAAAIIVVVVAILVARFRIYKHQGGLS